MRDIFSVYILVHASNLTAVVVYYVARLCLLQ